MYLYLTGLRTGTFLHPSVRPSAMSVSVLPEWKQLLLERKRREEEERERREREEEERLASMPAWKRGIIQRRRAKQEGGGDRERDREGDGIQYGFTSRSFDAYCDEQLMLRQTDSEIDTTSKETFSQVSVETIGPIRQNPFIRSQNSYKRENRRREAERENHGKEKETSGEDYVGEKEKDTRGEDTQNQEREFWRGRDREIRLERTRDRSEGREKVGVEGIKDREKDVGRGRKEGERDGVCLSLSSGLRTIKAENIIIIEKDGKTGEREREEREGERLAEQEEKKGMRMDLREILASGGNVTEIKASEVLIIKPSISEEKNREVEQGSERKSSKENAVVIDKGKEGRDQDRGMKVAEVWSGNTITLHEDLFKQDKDSLGSGRVSQILSKFGQQLKSPCRSKSIDFIRPGKENSRIRLIYGQEEERKEEMDSGGFKGVPKRSFSFSEQVVSEERKVVERAYSDRRHPPPVMIVQSESVDPSTRKPVRVRDDHQLVMQRKREIEGEVEKVEPKVQESRIDRQGDEGKERDAKGQGNSEASGGEVFSMASVRKPEGIAFARRIPIRQDRKELKRLQENRVVDRDNVSRPQKERDKKTEKLQRDSDKGRQVEVHIEEKAESIKLRRDGEEVTVVMESVKSSCSCILDSHHWSNSHTVSDHKTESQQHPAVSGVRLRKDDATTDYCKPQNQPEHVVPPQNRDERLSKTGIVQEIRDHKNIGPSQESDAPGNKDKTEKSMIWHEQEELLRSTSISNSYHPSLKSDEALEPPAPKSPKHAPWMSGVAQQEIRIPRSVFFGVEEMAEEHKPSLSLEGEGQIVGGDKERGVERRESWKAGRPLTRVESLRERIRQREMERKKRGEVEGEGGRETDRSEGEGMEKGGGEKRREAEGAQRCSVMVNRQEAAVPQTLSLFDVTKEVSVSKASPQLPASVPLLLSQSLSAGREAPQLSNNGKRYLEQDEEFRQHQDTDSLTRAPGEEGETEDDLLEDKYLCPSQSPSPTQSLSPTPSPPLPNSLAAMSRIYNLKTVGSRTAVCISERNSDVTTHSKKVFPEGRFTPKSHSVTQTSVSLGTDRTARDGQSVPTTETSAVQSVQRQLGQLQLREQEVKQSSPGNGDMQYGPQKETGRKTAEGQKRPETQTETQNSESPTSSRASPSQQTGSRIPTKLPQPKSFTINGRNAQSPENVQKPPPSSPSSPSSISLSPSLAPSPTRSSPLFSIRSASGGPGKRGTTITITPRRPAAGNSPTPPTPAASSPSASSPSALSPSATPTIPEIPVPIPETNNTDEGRKKRYPTVEEIEVIGGYQNLENSCMVKNRGSPKGASVRFESQLERVCEYPSEDSVLASMPAGGDEPGGEDGRTADRNDEGQEEEEDEEGGAFVSSGAKSVGTSTGATRVLRVDESCRR
ncbi:zinc finger CCCH domain-containing protein 13 isoform X1 [Astyanax mexicanus]|uniref:zinc finger CCCH domain-containing protein 13 isoform X1 n=2 Tax=Astyanax mexicanus TaxID=7994 RepID=UPI0020CB66E1|nr:zinc finger CCCH domain-containing protein 13 isoform X1 [Astyanax mexicanus]